MIVGDVDGAGDRLAERRHPEGEAVARPVLFGDLELGRIARARVLDGGLDAAGRLGLAVLMGYRYHNRIHKLPAWTSPRH
jgi:hypothetical protein